MIKILPRNLFRNTIVSNKYLSLNLDSEPSLNIRSVAHIPVYI